MQVAGPALGGALVAVVSAGLPGQPMATCSSGSTATARKTTVT